jgi:hypothetical protein
MKLVVDMIDLTADNGSVIWRRIVHDKEETQSQKKMSWRSWKMYSYK